MTSDMYNSPQVQPNANNPNRIQSDVCYLPSAPAQSAPPPLYPTGVPPPPPPPYVIPSTAQMAMYPTSPVFVTQMQVPYQGVIIAGSMAPPQTIHIKDYMVWSIINIFLGGLFLGLIVVLLSSQTRKRKLEGDIQGARTMSNITLTCNIIITILFFATTAFLIVYFVIILSSLEELYK